MVFILGLTVFQVRCAKQDRSRRSTASAVSSSSQQQCASCSAKTDRLPKTSALRSKPTTLVDPEHAQKNTLEYFRSNKLSMCHVLRISDSLELRKTLVGPLPLEFFVAHHTDSAAARGRFAFKRCVPRRPREVAYMRSVPPPKNYEDDGVRAFTVMYWTLGCKDWNT